MSVRYLATDITGLWNWQGTSSADAGRKLDDLIKLRGDLVHHARNFIERKAQVYRYHLENAINLVQRLVIATEKGLGIDGKAGTP
jgi:hypothetical protein